MPFDINNATQRAALASEIQTDPQTYGYAALVASGSDNAIAELLNKVRDGTDGETAISVRRSDISSSELWHQIDMADMATLSGSPSAAALSAERKDLTWLAGLAVITPITITNPDGTNSQVAVNLLRIFPAGSGTRARIITISTRNGSRMEQLFGAGSRATDRDVAIALGRGG